ncbi:MAG: mechanosensitive ion channel domain-containing protein, partial [Desulfobacterales bacterium]
RKVWLSDKKRWDEWQSSQQKDGDFEQLRTAVEKANKTITTALEQIHSRMGAVLALQERGGSLQDQISTLDVELSALIVNEKRSTLFDESPPMLSAQFFASFKSGEIWSAAIQGPDEITWPDSRFFARHGWIVLLQVVLTLLVTISTFRNRRFLDQSARWKFFAARPISGGLFVGYMSTVVIYGVMDGVPETWNLAEWMVAAIAFARLMGSLSDTPWKRQFINGLMIVLIAALAMEMLSFPIPLYRLFTAAAALVGLIFCWRLTGASMRDQVTSRYRWLLRLGAPFFLVIFLAELWGNRLLASHLFASSIRSLATVMAFILLMVMIRGALEWLFKNTPLRQTSVMTGGDTQNIIDRLAHLIDLAIVGLVLLPAILVIWGVYDNLVGATKGLLALGVNLGSQRITVGLLLGVGGIVYGSFFISWILQTLLVDEALFKQRVEKGVRLSIARLVNYAVLLIGFLLALSTLGFEISKITILLSALGVGIGFGLQGIVNNFVSGLILLFERPVRVGDTIEIGGTYSEIKNIGIRATTVQTFDLADRIIPNADLISNEVTNWTLTNRQVRLIIPVGVAYGSDVDRVTETLLNCAKTNPKVAKRPEPKVRFLNFGDSTLDFELRVFVPDFDLRIEVRDMLHRQIDRCFRDANIEIAFPQRDVHMRGVDTPVGLPPSEEAVS